MQGIFYAIINFVLNKQLFSCKCQNLYLTNQQIID